MFQHVSSFHIKIPGISSNIDIPLQVNEISEPPKEYSFQSTKYGSSVYGRKQ